jgi:hypothetical protein
MQLNISELDDNFTSFSSEAYTNEYDNDQFGSQLEYEKIPKMTEKQDDEMKKLLSS